MPALARAPWLAAVDLDALIGQGSSARANGGFRAQFSTASNIAFSMFSIAALEAMDADAIDMHQTGYLLVTGTEAGERSLRATHDLQLLIA